MVGLGVFFYMKENQCTYKNQTEIEEDLKLRKYLSARQGDTGASPVACIINIF
jgi:hypothetical protein